jgi:hypothetical protein
MSYVKILVDMVKRKLGKSRSPLRRPRKFEDVSPLHSGCQLKELPLKKVSGFSTFIFNRKRVGKRDVDVHVEELIFKLKLIIPRIPLPIIKILCLYIFSTIIIISLLLTSIKTT